VNAISMIMLLRAREVHIISHSWSPEQGHNLKHVAIEEEGARAILAWWKESL
jgi:hypothetical protein